MLAALSGHVLEWFDFGAYAAVVPSLGRHFFPQADPAAALLATLATFGIGFVIRPLGAIVIGRIADRLGRRAAMMITMNMMAAGTFAIGLLPSYENVGLLAPILLIVARLTQGFAAAGEIGASMTFLVEWVDVDRQWRGRGFAGGLQQATISAAFLLGLSLAAALSSAMTPDAFDAWGWRMPFLSGLLLLPVAWYLRYRVRESTIFEEARRVAHRRPFNPLEKFYFSRTVGFAYALQVPWNLTSYIIVGFLPSFMQAEGGFDRTTALLISTCALIGMTIFPPITGVLSDRWGRRPVWMFGLIGISVLSWPTFHIIAAHGETHLVLPLVIALAVSTSFLMGAGPAIVTELFPTRSRALGVSLSSGLVNASVGGFAPLVAAWLIAGTRSATAPAYLLIAGALISVSAIILAKETNRTRLEDVGWRAPHASTIGTEFESDELY